MILLGCFLAFGLALAPRVFLVLAWILSERWVRVWQGEFLIPLLGIIFLPYTTIMYMLVWTPRGIEGWDWLWIILGLLLDLWKWQSIIQNRRTAMETSQEYYSRRGTGDTVSQLTAPRSSSAAAAPGATAPEAAPAVATAEPSPPAETTTTTETGAAGDATDEGPPATGSSG